MGSLYSLVIKESTSSEKFSDPKGRKILDGTDGPSWDKGCLLASQECCDKGNDSNEISGGVGETFGFVHRDDD